MADETERLRVALVSPEVRPFATTGGLGDVAAFLALELKKLGHDIRLVMPDYAMIEEQGYTLEKLPSQSGPPEVPPFGPLSFKTTHLAEFGSNSGVRVPVYFVAADGLDYYSRVHRRDQLYGWPDDAGRFVLFCRGALELFKAIGWRPDVIHCNDWQTGLIPAYLDTLYKQDFPETATMYTIHNVVFSGPAEAFAATLSQAGLAGELPHPHTYRFWGNFNFAKGAMLLANVVNTVSPTYSREILCTEEELRDRDGQPYQVQVSMETPEGAMSFAHRLKIYNGVGFEDILRQRDRECSWEQLPSYLGILNGIDYDFWNPKTDGRLEARNLLQAIASADWSGADEDRLAGRGLLPMSRSLKEQAGAEKAQLDDLAFSAEEGIEAFLQRKRRSKRRLQWLCGLEQRDDLLLVGHIGRIGDQKDGLLMVQEQEALRRILGLDLQMVALGRASQKDPAGVRYRQEFVRLDHEARRSKAGRFCFVNERYRDLLGRDLGEEEDYDVEHLIYAGSDAFLLPSLYEPCGLSQMIGFRYGTLPIVSKTGGLADTVRHWNEETSDNKGPGFVFCELSPQRLAQAVEEATALYRNDQALWGRLILEGLSKDFSWGRPAREYVQVYRRAIARRRAGA